MDWERSLIGRTARDQSIGRLLTMGIEARHFDKSPDGKPNQNAEIFAFMLNHVRLWNAPPSYETVVEAYPNYDFDDSKDTLEFITTKFLNQVKRREAERSLVSLANQMVSEDAERFLENIDGHFLAAARDLATVLPKNYSERFSDMNKRVDKYESIQQWGGLQIGLPYPFPDVNAITMGIQPHEFVTISGWSGLGKSYLGLLCCYHAYLAGKTPLIISLEMGAEAINRRLDIMATNISHTAMKSINLVENDIEHWKEIAGQVELGRQSHDIIVLDNLGRCTADKVYAETVRYNPDLVLVDYLSLMDSDSGFRGAHWEKITEITRRLKAQARGLNIPIIAIAQTNRSSAKEGARDDNIAYANSILQDSDVVFGLHRDSDMKLNNRMLLSLLKNREGIIRDFDLYWDVERGMIRPWSPGDLFTNNVTDSS